MYGSDPNPELTDGEEEPGWLTASPPPTPESSEEEEEEEEEEEYYEINSKFLYF